jgi:hypothetical protein
MRDSVPQITGLLDAPDILEVVRDQIAAVLSLELRNQRTLAFDFRKQDAKDYDIAVFIENARPYDGEGVLKALVNVLLPKAQVLDANSRVGSQKTRATFWLDCAAWGNDAGWADDRSAALRAWKTARMVRRILMADVYAYLGLRGIVASRRVVSMEAGTPGNTENSAFAVSVVRISLEVDFLEKSIGVDCAALESIHFEISPDTGEIMAGDGD